jgi:hypothetical protein
MFSIQPGKKKPNVKYVPRVYFRERGAGAVLTPEELASLDPNYSRAIPLIAPGKPLPRANHADWGLELGRRYRDWIRRARKNDVRIDTWQFDEILLEVEVGVSRAQQRLYRAFIGGILRGLFEGREELGDKMEKGIVWYALQHPPLRSDPLPLVSTKTPGLAQFWEILNTASWRVVGQEYTLFDGNAEAVANWWARFQQHLLRRNPLGGPIRRAIGAKYAVGMSPGYNSDTRRLGGVIHKTWTRQQVNAWRNRYVRRRALVAHPSGFAQYNFTGGNATLEPPTLDSFRAVTFGLSFTAR